MDGISNKTQALGWRAQGYRWVRHTWRNTLTFPWRTTAVTLRERFRDDRLGVTAGSLTFTTMISLVPLFTVGLAIFSAFPMFGRMEAALQKWLVASLVPDSIARQVSAYLLQFAAKADRMGWAGALTLLATALALILTIDRKLNDIWRVKHLRPLAQRVLVYWALLTLGPLLMGMSLSFTSYALATSRGWSAGYGALFGWVLDMLGFAMTVFAMAALYRYVPNARVLWRHALVGGLFVWVTVEFAKDLLGWYFKAMPTYSFVYGTFATLPILLIWLYVVWVLVLLGAVVVAYLPSLLVGIARRSDTPGWRFQLALDVLRALWAAQEQPKRGLSTAELANQLQVDPLNLETPLAALIALDWVGRLAETDERHVLLVAPQTTALAPLMQRLLLAETTATQSLWNAAGWHKLLLSQALARN
ncbi:MAG: hypothetical protein RI959_1903 [Pseudomonadota bacterium]|jgi:membrane protein